MSLSTQTVLSNGTLTLLSLSIDFVTRSSIKVFFDNSEQTLGTTWSWVGTTGNTIAFSPAVPNTVVVIVRRSTDLSSPTHVFNAGAQFNEASLDANFTQVLHSAQESSEGATVKESFVNFDLHSNRITSLGNGTAASDAVNKGQLDALGVITAASDAASAASAAAALVSANASSASADVASTKASEANASAIAAAASAGAASTSAGAAASSAANASALVSATDLVKQTGPTGAVIGPAGTTAQRPVSPVVGYTRYNTTLNIPEVWNDTAWVAMGGGAVGGGTDAIGVENDTFIAAPYTIGAAAILPCTISIASPCVITQANTYAKDQTVRFTSTGALPTGLGANEKYYVIAAGLTTSSFQVSLTQGGTAVNTSGTQSGTQGVGKTKNMNVAGGITIGDAGGITIPTGCGLVIGG